MTDRVDIPRLPITGEYPEAPGSADAALAGPGWYVWRGHVMVRDTCVASDFRLSPEIHTIDPGGFVMPSIGCPHPPRGTWPFHVYARLVDWAGWP